MSSWIAITEANFAVDKAGTSQDMLEIIHNQIAIKEFAKRIDFGGDPTFQYINTAYGSQSFPVYAEIDGTNIGGLIFELHFMCICTPGDTISVQLWNRTTLASIIETTTSPTTLQLIRSAPFSLPTTVGEYEVRVKAAIGGAAKPFSVYGATLVQK